MRYTRVKQMYNLHNMLIFLIQDLLQISLMADMIHILWLNQNLEGLTIITTASIIYQYQAEMMRITCTLGLLTNLGSSRQQLQDGRSVMSLSLKKQFLRLIS